MLIRYAILINCTQRCTHIRTYAPTQTHTWTHTYTSSQKHIHVQPHTHIPIYIHTNIQVCTIIYKHMQTHPLTRLHGLAQHAILWIIHACADNHLRIHTHTCACIPIHTHIYVLIYTQAPWDICPCVSEHWEIHNRNNLSIQKYMDS